VKSFEEFGLKESLLHRLKKKGIKTPTKIQNDAMGPIAQGKDPYRRSTNRNWKNSSVFVTTNEREY